MDVGAIAMDVGTIAKFNTNLNQKKVKALEVVAKFGFQKWWFNPWHYIDETCMLIRKQDNLTTRWWGEEMS